MGHHFSKKKCVPCEGGIPAIAAEKAQEFLKELPGWTLSPSSAIATEYVMKNFMSAIRLIDAIAKVAEAEGHHPDLHLTSYRKLKVEISTHAIGGLSENDFILAAKINDLPKELKTN